MTTNNWHVITIPAPKKSVFLLEYYLGWSPCIEWCGNQFGKNQVTDGWCFEGEGVFKFKHERDLILFLLRW